MYLIDANCPKCRKTYCLAEGPVCTECRKKEDYFSSILLLEGDASDVSARLCISHESACLLMILKELKAK